jgi:hypothetical protein
MIQPTSNYFGYNRTNAASEPASQPTAPAANPPAAESVPSEQLSSTNTDALRAALNNTPEIRPEVVARGQQLSKWESYPPLEIINRLAEMIISSDDPSDNAS